MKNLFNISIIAIIVGLSSCTKIIELDLNDADRVIVVDAMVSNIAEYNYVKLSKSDNFYETEDFENVTGAVISISDENGNIFPLLEVSPGMYTNPLLVGTDYTTYDLSIDVEGEIITASTYLAGSTSIDSIVTQKAPGGFFGDGYTAFTYWTDDVSERNYYRIRTFENGAKENIIYFSEDGLYNGIATGQPLFTNTYDSSDIARIELMEIDADTYEYWFSLSQISDPQNQPAAPGNPETNLSGNAIGYFGGYNMDTISVIVQ
ncbi:MAG: hypothetical protein ACI9N1_001052 [Flavobacteriales bacterium]|jgi:hypothetical protein